MTLELIVLLLVHDVKLVSEEGNIIFKVGETNEVARFDSSGNLGIGTTSPAMPVEIVTGSGATVDLPNQTTGGIAFANNSLVLTMCQP